MKRVKFGIAGLDSALRGGLEEGSSTLVSGGPGTGKTSMGLQFIYKGAQSGESGIYVSFEEQKEKLLRSAKNLGMKGFEPMVRSGKIMLIGPKDLRPDLAEGDIAKEISQIAGRRKARRLVIDTLTTLAISAMSPRWKVAATQPSPKLVLFQPTKSNVKQFILNFIGTINRAGDATMLFLSEADDEYTTAQKYLCDSVIEIERPSLEVTQDGEVLLRVIKTRRSPHSPAVHVVRIKAKEGVEVVPAAEALKV